MPEKLALCIRLSSLGDVINTLYAVEQLKDKYRMHFLTETSFSDLIVNNPLFENVFTLPVSAIRNNLWSPFQWPKALQIASSFAKNLRKEKYDIVFDFHSNLKSALNTWFSRSKIKRGFGPGDCYEFAHIFYNEKLSLNGNIMHRQDKFASLAGTNLPKTSGLLTLPSIPEISRDKLREFLSKFKIVDSKYIVIHPGTSRTGEIKRWETEKWVRLITSIYDNFGVRSVLTWGKGELSLVRMIAQLSSYAAIPCYQTRSLHDLRAVISASILFISCDTGPLHLACAEDKKSIGLYGPKDPRVYAPRSTSFHLIKSPTGKMKDISVENVLEAASKQLS
ncbi:MAG: glycosyltransferase family 9 protein [Planctomycetes bacterium]|nr:glycosyltransferase family 9 protein [Planctomycetota bacterium]